MNAALRYRAMGDDAGPPQAHQLFAFYLHIVLTVLSALTEPAVMFAITWQRHWITVAPFVVHRSWYLLASLPLHFFFATF